MPSRTRRNQSWLAEKIGISRSRLVHLCADPEWRWPRRDWTDAEVAQIRKWHRGRRAIANATADRAILEEIPAAALDSADPNEEIALLGPERKAKLQLMVERAAKIKLERDLLLGGFIKKEEVEASRIERIVTVRAKLLEIPQRAAQLVGLSEGAIAGLLMDWVAEACNSFAGNE